MTWSLLFVCLFQFDLDSIWQSVFGVPSSQPITAIKRDPKAEMCADGAVVMLAMIRAMLNQVDMRQKTSQNICVMFCLTHCGLVMPYGDIDLGQHWPR